jgi:hypothetical protein
MVRGNLDIQIHVKRQRIGNTDFGMPQRRIRLMTLYGASTRKLVLAPIRSRIILPIGYLTLLACGSIPTTWATLGVTI